jgi:hypothetical protein
MAQKPRLLTPIIESYLQREAHPDIGRAFRSGPLEDIPGTPSIRELEESPMMGRFLKEHGHGLGRRVHVSCERGVTVAVAVSFIGDDGRTWAECSWRAGSGIAFSSSVPARD